MSSVFSILLLLVTLATISYVMWSPYGAVKYDWRWVTLESCKLHSDQAKTIITCSGIATAILASLAIGKAPSWLLQRAMGLLIASIIFAVLFLLIFSRATEAAINRYQDQIRGQQEEIKQRGPVGPTQQGTLNYIELGLTLLCAFLAITAFMWGFLYLGQIVFIL